MPGFFLRALEQLTVFIANHPEIEIGESVASIPENVRSDFYSRFNSVRRAFIEEKFPDYVCRTQRLQKKYALAAEENARTLMLDDAPAPNVRILAVGFDRIKLVPVIDSLSDEGMPAI